MKPRPISNYPRAVRPSRSASWIGDRIFGFVHLMPISYATFSTLTRLGRNGDEETQTEWILVLLIIVPLITVPVLGVLLSRRWGMWSYLGLTIASFLWNATHQWFERVPDAGILVHVALSASTLVYLPLRLTRRLGPAPR